MSDGATTTHAIRIHETGGPEVLRWETVPIGDPQPGQVLLRQTAVGLNFIDTYHRSGLYPVPLPATLGREAAGVVEQVGPGVTDWKPGDRATYAMAAGSYCERRWIEADVLIPLPDEIPDATAAAMMLKGLTAQYLLRRTYRVERGDTVLVHAAAGGVGSILCQWASHLGATVIGTVGTDEKAELARAHGCRHPIVYTRENFRERVRELAPDGLPVVYDSVGKDTFEASLDCLRPRGLMVSFGQASGKIPPVDIGILAAKGSLFLTRPTLASFVADRSELLESARELFAVVGSGAVRIEIGQTYPLAEAERAHRDLEGRRTRGATVLEI